MSEQTANNQTAVHNEVAYATSWEHLSDELKRLEMVIHFQVLKQRNWRLANPLDQFKGLVVSEEEITDSRLTFLLSNQPWKPQGLLNEHVFIAVDFPVPDERTRKQLWESHPNGHYRLAGEADAGELASKFRFTPGQIRDAPVEAQNLAR